MPDRDGSEASTRIALVPERDEVDWIVSALATDLLEDGSISFDHDDARWVRTLGPYQWFNMGDGTAAMRLPTSVTDDRPYLRVGELVYRIGKSRRWLQYEYLFLQLVDLCAPVEDLAEDADEQWERVPPGFWSDFA